MFMKVVVSLVEVLRLEHSTTENIYVMVRPVTSPEFLVVIDILFLSARLSDSENGSRSAKVVLRKSF